MYLGSLSVCLAVYVANPSVPDRNEKRGRQPVFVPNSICRSTYQAERTPAGVRQRYWEYIRWHDKEERRMARRQASLACSFYPYAIAAKVGFKLIYSQYLRRNSAGVR